VKQLKMACKDDMAKRNFLNAFFEYTTSQAMIFVNSRETANFLINLFEKLSSKLQRNIDCRILTGENTPEQRDKTIKDFRMNKFSALISTNLLARGIDVPEVDIVINYDIPFISENFYKEPDYANYLHRVGRTGRF
jgi:ATP-dependent RNA helicase DDX19/DBP5